MGVFKILANRSSVVAAAGASTWWIGGAGALITAVPATAAGIGCAVLTACGIEGFRKYKLSETTDCIKEVTRQAYAALPTQFTEFLESPAGKARLAEETAKEPAEPTEAEMKQNAKDAAATLAAKAKAEGVQVVL